MKSQWFGASKRDLLKSPLGTQPAVDDKGHPEPAQGFVMAGPQIARPRSENRSGSGTPNRWGKLPVARTRQIASARTRRDGHGMLFAYMRDIRLTEPGQIEYTN